MTRAIMKLKMLPLCMLTLLPVGAAAQKLAVESKTIDAGKTGYQMPVTAVFECSNKGSQTLVIEKVVPDCSCTVLDYPKNGVAPGGKFKISMTYDARQLGHFDKQAAIVSNASHKPVYLCMKGLVLANWRDYSKEFPVRIGNLLIDRMELEFDNVYKGERQEQVLYIHNDGTTMCQPSMMHLPSWLTAEMKPERLLPGTSGMMTLTLDSEQLHDYGLTQSTVYLAAVPGDTVSADRELSASAIMIPAFTGLSEQQRADAPRLHLSAETVRVAFDGKRKKSAVIEVSNRGKTELDISSLQLFTSGLEVSLGQSRLAPGKKTKLKIIAMRDELSKVKRRPRILMITNDPAKPKVTITIELK